MAKESIRDGTPRAVQDGQLSDMLPVMDQKEFSLRAVSEIDRETGRFKTVPADDEHQNDFLKIDREGNILENFISNFRRQFKDPARFNLLRIDRRGYRENREGIKNLAEGKQTPATRKLLEKYKIREGDVAKEENNTNTENENVMAKKNQQEKQAPTGQQPAQQPGGSGNEAPKYRFNESMIDWEQLKNFGLSREFLKEKGLLDDMLKGWKSRELVPVSMNFGSAILRCDARLSFQQSVAGPVVLSMHGIRREPEFDKPYFGHTFSEEDRKNLRESGNMGRVVDLKMRSGEYAPSFISIDKLTNEIVALKAESAYIPNEIRNVTLTDREKNDLREGKPVFVEGLISGKGAGFDATIQVNAGKRGIEYIFDNNRLFNNESIGGVKLTDRQSQDLSEGKAIFLEDMKSKDGRLYSSFVKLDEGSGRLTFLRYNPDTPAEEREIYVPKEIGGVTLTAEDRGQLREGKPVFLENMVNRRGEEYSSFVKLDMKNGDMAFSRTPDGFEERPAFKVPAEIWGVTLTATQRAGLQDGKAVLVEGMKGFDGKTFGSYLKVNQAQGKLDYYNENPDLKKNADKRNVVDNKQAEKQGNKEDGKPKRKAGRSVA